MKTASGLDVAPQTLDQITGDGAFLNAYDSNRVNTMTIGWATLGVVWKKPIMMVAVRLSRYSFGIIEKSNDFSVSVPSGDMKKELLFCGTKSGKDYDKFKECNMETIDAQKIKTPIINIPGIHYECKIVFKSAMDPVNLIDGYESLYPKRDYHTLYYGEIVDCYTL